MTPFLSESIFLGIKFSFNERTEIENLSKEITRTITLKPSEIIEFCGKNDQRIKEMEAHLEAQVLLRGNEVKIIGTIKEVESAEKFLKDLLHIERKDGESLKKTEMKKALRSFNKTNKEGFVSVFSDRIPVPLRKKRIRPLTPGQKFYVDAIRRSDIVFSIGSAGTGKTYLAVAMAVSSLIEEKVDRIILVRPAVEAGEKLGFLPGDISQKFDPYVRPLYDALYDMIEAEKVNKYCETGAIEIAPLAFMRGRTLNNAFVILDEAQNTTIEQMKMFLTRLGFDSKAVVTGDITQIDLPDTSKSGLLHVQKILKDIEGIEFTYLDEKDVVRHELVQSIIKAYEQNGTAEPGR